MSYRGQTMVCFSSRPAEMHPGGRKSKGLGLRAKTVTLVPRRDYGFAIVCDCGRVDFAYSRQ